MARGYGTRKPVHLAAAGGFLTAEQRVWAAMRRRESFDLAEIQFDTKVPMRTIKSYVLRLRKARPPYLVTIEHRRSPVSGTITYACYRVARHKGVEAPRLKPDGTASTSGIVIEQMWRTVRMNKRDDWNYRELAREASTAEHPVSERRAKRFVSEVLKKAGYVVVTREAQSGEAGGLARYRLVPRMDRGPRAPIAQRSGAIFDPNRCEVVWQP